MSWWETLIDDSLEDGVKGTLKWAWRKIGPRAEGPPKLVSQEYITATGLEKQAHAEGYKLRWINPENVALREAEGWEYVYEPDDEKNSKQRLVNRVNAVLMKKAI